MSLTIRGLNYFYAMVKDRPGEAYRMLSALSAESVNLLAFCAIPMGPDDTQLILYPESDDELAGVAEKLGLTLTGPQRAFLIQGDDKLGALAEIHARLFDFQVNVYSSNGVTDGRGGYGYILNVRPEDFETASSALGV